MELGTPHHTGRRWSQLNQWRRSFTFTWITLHLHVDHGTGSMTTPNRCRRSIEVVLTKEELFYWTVLPTPLHRSSELFFSKGCSAYTYKVWWIVLMDLWKMEFWWSGWLYRFGLNWLLWFFKLFNLWVTNAILRKNLDCSIDLWLLNCSTNISKFSCWSSVVTRLEKARLERNINQVFHGDSSSKREEWRRRMQQRNGGIYGSSSGVGMEGSIRLNHNVKTFILSVPLFPSIRRNDIAD